MRIKIVTKEHEYQGLYHDTVIEDAMYVGNGNCDQLIFKHNGKEWVVDREDIVFVQGDVVQTTKESDTVSALDKQVSGSHYKDFKIQPVEYIYANNIPFLEANVIKYTSRHRAKNKSADIKKAIHCLELILQMEYGE